MSLSSETIALLRDEAYLALCRHALDHAISEAAEKAQQVRQTRPPFGILATKKTREVFEKSLQDAVDGQTALQHRLDKVAMLETWVRSEIRPQLHRYLYRVSAEYRSGGDVRSALTQVSNQISQYAECLQAYAREIRSLSLATVNREGRESINRAYAELKQSAAALDCQTLQYELNAQRAARVAEKTIYEGLRIPGPPIPTQAITVDRLAQLDEAEAVAQMQQIEGTIRATIAERIPQLQTAIDAGHEYVTQRESAYLDNYWQQLRVHAQTHYVAERDLDEVINELSGRYIEQHRQLEAKQSPYLHER